MRCEVYFDENKPLMEQEVKAWGEMQILTEEPDYKESDIKYDFDIGFFRGYKLALDTVCNILLNFEFENKITKKLSEDIQCQMSGELCMVLFSILDNQLCEEDEDE